VSFDSIRDTHALSVVESDALRSGHVARWKLLKLRSEEEMVMVVG